MNLRSWRMVGLWVALCSVCINNGVSLQAGCGFSKKAVAPQSDKKSGQRSNIQTQASSLSVESPAAGGAGSAVDSNAACFKALQSHWEKVSPGNRAKDLCVHFVERCLTCDAGTRVRSTPEGVKRFLSKRYGCSEKSIACIMEIAKNTILFNKRPGEKRPDINEIGPTRFMFLCAALESISTKNTLFWNGQVEKAFALAKDTRSSNLASLKRHLSIKRGYRESFNELDEASESDMDTVLTAISKKLASDNNVGKYVNTYRFMGMLCSLLNVRRDERLRILVAFAWRFYVLQQEIDKA